MSTDSVLSAKELMHHLNVADHDMVKRILTVYDVPYLRDLDGNCITTLSALDQQLPCNWCAQEVLHA